MEVFEKAPELQITLDDFIGGTIIKTFNWSAYNQSQASGKNLFLKFLSDLCNILDDSISYIGKGRKPMPSAHMIYCMGVRTYSGVGVRSL